jgi:hypothetical protein
MNDVFYLQGVRYHTQEQFDAAMERYKANQLAIWRRSAILAAAEISEQHGASIRQVLETQCADGEITYSDFTVGEIKDALAYRAEIEESMLDMTDAPVDQR